MSQQEMTRKANSYSNDQASSVKPLPFSDAIWQLPLQYYKVLCRPSAQTFREEMGKASWGIVFVQFDILVIITLTLSYLAHHIPSSLMHITSAISLGSFQPFAFLPSPYNGIVFILGSFFIGLSTAYLFSKIWRGQGSFLAHTYSLLLCTVPLVTISGALLLIPATGPLAILLISLLFILFTYRMILHGCIIVGIHDLSAGKATLIVLIIPMFVVGLAVLGLLIFTGGENLGDLFGVVDWVPGKSEKRDKDKPPTD